MKSPIQPAQRKSLLSKRQEGFSLIELVTVVSVLSVLASIGFSSFNSFRRRTDEVEAKVMAHNIIKTIGIYSLEEGRYPNTWAEIGSKFQGLRYCLGGAAAKRQCGTGVGDSVTGADPHNINGYSSNGIMNCIVVTQASYEMCGKKSNASGSTNSGHNKIQTTLKEYSNIDSNLISQRKSVSACISNNGSVIIQQNSRDEVWIDC